MAEGTVYPIKRRYADAGLDGVLQDRVQSNRFRKLDNRGEAHLIALACSDAPEGQEHWTLRLLAEQGGGIGVGAVAVPRDGKAQAQKNVLKPWRKQQWCIPKVGDEFVAAMEDVLDLCAEPYDPQRPGGVLRRDLHPVAGRGARAVARPAGTTAAAGLRVSSRRHPQHLPGLSRVPGGGVNRCSPKLTTASSLIRNHNPTKENDGGQAKNGSFGIITQAWYGRRRGLSAGSPAGPGGRHHGRRGFRPDRRPARRTQPERVT